MRSNPSDVGARSEIEVARALVLEGWDVCVPLLCAHSRFDLVALRENEVLRIQCKTARLLKGVLYFRTCSNTNNHPRPYHGEVDAFGVYSPDLGSAYLVPIAGLGNLACHLRLGPTANNQAKGVRYASDYEIGRMPSPGESLQLL